jgi:hypothetical protein
MNFSKIFFALSKAKGIFSMSSIVSTLKEANP